MHECVFECFHAACAVRALPPSLSDLGAPHWSTFCFAKMYRYRYRIFPQYDFRLIVGLWAVSPPARARATARPRPHRRRTSTAARSANDRGASTRCHQATRQASRPGHLMTMPMALTALVVSVVAATGQEAPLSPFPSLAISFSDQSLNTTASIIDRVVSRKSGCVVKPGDSKLTLTLVLDPALGPEAYTASFDGQHSATVRGGNPAGVTFGAGAFLRSSRFTPVGLIPPQHRPPPPTPLPQPPVPIVDEWWPGEVNHSYSYGACGGDNPEGCPDVPLLGLVDSMEECKQLCVHSNITRCTSCGWIPNLAQWSRRCYARHDGVWNPSPVPVPGAVWARRFKLPLPPPPPPPPPAPPPPPPSLQPWSAHGAPAVPGSFRGLYFATHFGNFFANAPSAAIHEYLSSGDYFS